MSELTKEQVFEFFDNMTIMDMSQFIKEFETRYGVTAAAPVAFAAGAGPAQEAATQEEEKTSFDVILSNIGSQKIQVIKVVREITALGLKEAKELAETAPKPIKTEIDKEEAEAIKAKFEAVGATVEIK